MIEEKVSEHPDATEPEKSMMRGSRDRTYGPVSAEAARPVTKEESSLRTDKRLQRLEQVMKAYNYDKSALLEVLHAAHDLYGYFDKPILNYIAERLKLPPSHVYGVASFYHLFKFIKPGTHVISVCMGTACYVKGAEEIVSAIEREFNCKRGGSTPDGRLSLFITRCMGGCAMAPVVVINNEFVGKATKEVILERIRKLCGG